MADKQQPRGFPQNPPMDENREDPLLATIREEGEANRKASDRIVKSLHSRLDKFSDTISTFAAQATLQTQAVMELVDLQKSMVSRHTVGGPDSETASLLKTLIGLQEQEMFNTEERRKMDDLRRQSDDQRRRNEPIILPNGQRILPDGTKPAEDKNPLADMLSGASGGIAALISGYALRKLGRTGLTLFMAPLIGDWVGEFVSGLSTDAGFSQAFAKSASDAADRGTIGVTIGSMFGARAATIFGAAGFVSTFGDELLDKLGFNKDTIIGSFAGHEITALTLTEGMLGTMTAAATGILSDPKMLKGIWKAANTETGKKVSMKGLQGAIGVGVLAAYMTYGDEVANWLTSQGMPEGFADTTVNVVGLASAGASLGGMFGPQGALVGAAIGLALGIGKSLLDWFKSADDEIRNAAYKGLTEAKKVVEEGGKLSDDMIADIKLAMQEAQKTKDKAVDDGKKAMASEVLNEGQALLAQDAASKPTGSAIHDLRNVIKSALSDEKVKSAMMAQHSDDKVGNFVKALGEVTGPLTAAPEAIASAIASASGYKIAPKPSDVEILTKPSSQQNSQPLLTTPAPVYNPTTPQSYLNSGALDGTGKSDKKADELQSLMRNNAANNVIINNVTSAPVIYNQGGNRSNSTSVTNIGSGHDDLSPSFGNR